MAKQKNKMKDKKIQPAALEQQTTETIDEVEETEAVVRQPPKMKRKEFEKALEPLQVELLKMQKWVETSGK